jgi:SAM-dependent methyltransferase
MSSPGKDGAWAEIPDPLAEAALLAREIAPALCRAVSRYQGVCDWYHGFWLCLRLMGVGKTYGGQAGFYLPALQEIAGTGDSPRVLVTGSADYAIPSLVLSAYARETAGLQLTVTDLCETPLYLTRWYAERIGADVTTDRADILDYTTEEPFDVALTNSFFGSFAPEQRPGLFAAWARLLRPGGKLLFTNRLRPGVTGVVRFSPSEVEAYCNTVAGEASRLPEPLNRDPEAMVAAARRYAETYISHPIGSQDDIVRYLEEAGFRVDSLVVAKREGREGGGISGPTTNQASEYARVIATRL